MRPVFCIAANDVNGTLPRSAASQNLAAIGATGDKGRRKASINTQQLTHTGTILLAVAFRAVVNLRR